MHIYAFGSICRGDVTPGSDIDLLAVTEGHDARFDVMAYSIYSYTRIREIWNEGNPFAWHLFLESRLLFADDASDFLVGLGTPRAYDRALVDCEKFMSLFRAAREAIEKGTDSEVFELSTAFLAIRNFASCFSLGVTSKPNFSRRSALHLDDHSLQINSGAFDALERARLLSTRGVGDALLSDEIQRACAAFEEIDRWMVRLIGSARFHERV